MSVWLKKVLLETAILGLLGAQGALAQPFGIDGLPPQARASVVADSYIVTLEDGADPSDVSSFVAAVTGGHITQVYGTAINGFAIQVPPGLAIASVATAHPSIARVERDLEAFLVKKPTNPGKGGGGGSVATANPDTATVAINTPVTIDVLANDSGSKLTITSFIGEDLGSVVIDSRGKSVTYTAGGTAGTDPFGYTITDKNGNTDSATVTVTVTGDASLNPPTAQDDAYGTVEDHSHSEPWPGVLSNDADYDYADLVSGPSNGTLLFELDGSFTYTPNANFNGPDSFEYDAVNAYATARATVTITVAPVNDAPVAVNDTAQTTVGSAVTIAVLTNDSDIDGDPLSVALTEGEANGTTLINADNTVTFTPAAGYEGNDAGFSYTISDGTLSAGAQVSVDVTPVSASAQVVPAGVERIGADLAFPIDCNAVRVAVIDTGADLDHPDLNVDQTYSQSFASGDSRNSADDILWHGTHVSGTIGAIDDLDGVVGVCPNATIVALRVFDDSDRGSFSDIIAAIDQVTAWNTDSDPENDVHVINMSLTGVGYLASLRTALQAAVGSGVFVAVAAGNASRDVYGSDGVLDSTNNPLGLCSNCDDTIPAAYPEVATVSAMADYDGIAGGDGGALNFYYVDTGELAATQWDDTFAFFSNYNAQFGSEVFVAGGTGGAIDVAAPGVYVLSTVPGSSATDYATGRMTGTSMASPHVAGAAALYMALKETTQSAAAVQSLREAMISTAEPQSDWGPLDTADPDGNKEGLLDAYDLTAPLP